MDASEGKKILVNWNDPFLRTDSNNSKQFLELYGK